MKQLSRTVSKPNLRLSLLMVTHYKMFTAHNLDSAIYLAKLPNFFVWTVAIPKAEFASDKSSFLMLTSIKADDSLTASLLYF